MSEDNNDAPGLATLLRRVSRTSVGALRNRAELFAVEWQEEKARLAQLLVWSLGLLFLAMFAVGLLTATLIMLVPEDYRIWTVAGLAALFIGGSIAALSFLKSLLKKEPFQESIEQVRKDAGWLDEEE